MYSYKGEPNRTTLDKIYSAIYLMGFRLTKTKSEIFEELYNKNNKIMLYHGSKFGVEKFSINGSKETNDFGKRLSHTYFTKYLKSNSLNFIISK